jgi:hypothetical protein
MPFSYEKFEYLGDSLIDYLMNANLLRFTLFERYLTTAPDYCFGEDFCPGDAH